MQSLCITKHKYSSKFSIFVRYVAFQRYKGWEFCLSLKVFDRYKYGDRKNLIIEKHFGHRLLVIFSVLLLLQIFKKVSKSGKTHFATFIGMEKNILGD